MLRFAALLILDVRQKWFRSSSGADVSREHLKRSPHFSVYISYSTSLKSFPCFALRILTAHDLLRH